MLQSKSSELMHREIIRWFADQPSQRSPFSIHRICNIGKSLDKKAGMYILVILLGLFWELSSHVPVDHVDF